jgi:hypothetical protein
MLKISNLTSKVILSSLVVANANAITYSTNSAGTLYQRDKGSAITTTIDLADLGLDINSDIDALSLGDDPNIFGMSRVDLFAIGSDAVATGGELYNDISSGKKVTNNIYSSAAFDTNRLFIKEVDSNLDSQIDAFDLGDLKEDEWIYFSLRPSSLDSDTVDINGTTYSSGDVLMVQYKNPSTLKVFATASEIGSPININALSIFDASKDGSSYDSMSDYITYSVGESNLIPTSIDVSATYQYGLGVSGVTIPHTNGAEFGLRVGTSGVGDDLKALEHYIVCENPCIEIIEGWGIYGHSTPIDNIEEFFGDMELIESVFAYDKSTKEWRAFSPYPTIQALIQSSSEIKVLDRIEVNEGFWIKGVKDGSNCVEDNQILDNESLTNCDLPTLTQGNMISLSYSGGDEISVDLNNYFTTSEDCPITNFGINDWLDLNSDNIIDSNDWLNGVSLDNDSGIYSGTSVVSDAPRTVEFRATASNEAGTSEVRFSIELKE